MMLTRPKKDGSHRAIFNLKRLNQSVSHHHFKIGHIRSSHQAYTAFLLYDIY